MADGLNRVMLLGNLGADPELRHTKGGGAVLNLRLATTETYFDANKQKQERTDWHSVVVWGKRGEALSRFLAKGSTIFVEGRLSTSSYDDKDGNKRYKTEVVATNVILAGGKRDDTGSSPRRREPNADPFADDKRGGGGPGRSAASDDAPPDDFGGDEDIPF